MSQAATLPDLGLTLADLLKRLGGISPSRVRLDPAPGKATEQDVLDIEAREGRLYELVDGVLVEKVMGFFESFLAMKLGHRLQAYLDRHNLGILAGEAGMLRIRRGLVRIPDLSFISWNRLPGREFPKGAIPNMGPDLAIEILSKGNTKHEMTLKLLDYFAAGARLVWYIDPRRRIVTSYTAPDRATVLGEDEALDGGEVLPGFVLPLRQLFAPPEPPRDPGD